MHLTPAHLHTNPAPPRRPSLRCLRALAVVCLIPLIAAAQSGPSEYDVKAAYLFNFGKFVKWPSTAKQPGRTFDICVLGQDHFGGTLDKVTAGETINGQPVSVKRLSSPADGSSCQIVFIDRSEEKRLTSLLPALDRAGVLTVSDMPGFSEHGGMIQFQLSGDRVRFEVNLGAAEHAGLSLSSDLLKVATKVRRAGAS
jgi:YfiR/HmsC-like